ncbi:allophanate hydrolase [Pseudomonas sp. RC10]|uniref:allophanate hydrolase n=1 Tax=Pseudomonas bambusae TaxID=3139142 RepID=UPI003138FBCA
MLEHLSLDFTRLRHAYDHQDASPVAVVREIYRRIAAHGDRHIWLQLAPLDAVLQQAAQVERRRDAGERLPLYGLPYGVKDNIHVAGMPTTSGCADFSYTASEDAAVVERLNAAGALFIGKQNMDQFATGLVGVRNLDGSCLNAFDADYIPGGSSSGSAVAVAVGHVAFSIGSDTGGSGRIPAACNNVVGLKPTPGVVSTYGFVYCNRSFDVAPVFALTVDDAYQVLDVLAGEDRRDLYSRPDPLLSVNAFGAGFEFLVPHAEQLEFFGDEQSARQYQRSLQVLAELGGTPRAIDLSPFLEAGRLLFDSPLVAERLVSYGETLARAPESIHPAVRASLQKAKSYDAEQTYKTLYRLRELQRETHHTLQGATALVLPTYGRLPTCAEVRDDPLEVNARMGRYTYFANPLRLSGISVPVGLRDDGLPFGLSLLGLPLHDLRLRDLASRLQRHAAGRLGATNWSLPDAV